MANHVACKATGSCGGCDSTLVSMTCRPAGYRASSCSCGSQAGAALVFELDGHDHRIHDDEHAYGDLLRAMLHSRMIALLPDCSRPSLHTSSHQAITVEWCRQTGKSLRCNQVITHSPLWLVLRKTAFRNMPTQCCRETYTSLSKRLAQLRRWAFEACRQCLRASQQFLAKLGPRKAT